jgi:ribosome biogenesis GTPase
MNGIVICCQGDTYIVEADGVKCLCHLRGRFKTADIRSTNPIAVGDHITFDPPEVEGGYGWITEVSDRRNYIVRKSVNLSKQSHILAANVDRAVLLVTINYPITGTTFIDRFLATSQAYDVETLLVFNKVDRYNTSETAEMHRMRELYQDIGYRCLVISAYTGEGIDDLRHELEHGVTLLAGHSGAGKSTISNILCPGANRATSEVSSQTNLGVHTTTYSQMYPIEGTEDGFLIDTPGIKGFGSFDFEKGDIDGYFPDIFRFAALCHYTNCTHTHEPKCAVQRAVHEGKIAPSRYKSYLSMLYEDSEEKYRLPQ